MIKQSKTVKLLIHYIDSGDYELADGILKKIPMKKMSSDELFLFWRKLDHTRFIKVLVSIERIILKRTDISAEIHRDLARAGSTPKIQNAAFMKLLEIDNNAPETLDMIISSYTENASLSEKLSKSKLMTLISKVGSTKQKIALFQKASDFEIGGPSKSQFETLVNETTSEECALLVPLVVNHSKGLEDVARPHLQTLLKNCELADLGTLLTKIGQYFPKFAQSACKAKIKTKAVKADPSITFGLLMSAATFFDTKAYKQLFEDTTPLHSEAWIEHGLKLSDVILARSEALESRYEKDELAPVIAWMQQCDPFAAEILPILTNMPKMLSENLLGAPYEELKSLIDISKANTSVLEACFGQICSRWDVVRDALGLVAPKASGALAEYVRGLKLKASVSSWDKFQTNTCNAVVEAANGASSFHAEFPPENSNVMLLCERGADPAPVLSTPLSYNFTHCSMDSLDKSLKRDKLDLWSLRDLLPDTSFVTTTMYLDGKRISEKLVQTYLAAKMKHEMKMGPEQFKRTLAIALEDTLMGKLVMGGCFLQALKQYKGENVIIAQNSGDVFMNFSESFLSLPDKKFYFNNTGVGRKKLQKKMINLATSRVIEPASTQGVNYQDIFEAYDDVDVFNPINTLRPNNDKPAVAFMGFFNDPIYIGNIIPVLKALIKKYDIYVIEANSSAPTLAALHEHFGEELTDNASGNQIHFVDMVTEIKKSLSDPRLSPANFKALSVLTQKSLAKLDYKTGGLEIKHLLDENLADWFRVVLARLEISFRFLTRFFETVPVQALYTCSERLASHMGAVEVANNFGIKTIDVMAVNSIRLPRYKAPMSTYCTAIDTITQDYFKTFFGLPDDRIALTGSPRLDSMLAEYKSAEADEVLKLLDIPKNKKIILVISQLQPIDRYISIFEQAIEAAKQSSDSYIIVKLHRRENFTREEIYRDYAQASGIAERIRIVRDEPILKNIENCLKVSDLVISMYSNVLREAVCVGIPIIIADYFNTELPFDYVSAGIGKAAKTPEQLTSIAIEFLSGEPDPVYQYKKDQYFSQNPQLLSGNASEAIANLI